MQNHMHLFDLSPLCAFKCLLKSPAWIHVDCIWFFSTMCFQMCPHCENILTSKGRGRRSWRNLKKVPLHSSSRSRKIPGFHNKNPGILINGKSPLGPAREVLVNQRPSAAIGCVFEDRRLQAATVAGHGWELPGCRNVGEWVNNLWRWVRCLSF